MIARPCLARSTDAAAFFAPTFALLRREALRIAHLDAEHRLLGVTHRYSDEADAVELPLRRIVADALALGADAIVLVHNHPSGDPAPSRTDLAATRKLAELVRPLGIRFLDHLIFARGDCSSLRALGLM